MQKKNIFQKKFNKSVLSITNRIESFFNFFRDNFFNKKKNILKIIDNRIILAFAIVFILASSYFLLPSFYDKNKIKTLIENQIFDKYNLEVKFDKPLQYGLLPRPHFYSENTIINYKSNEIARSNNTKILIFVKNFFSSENLTVSNLIFKKTDFKIDNSNFEFFAKLLNNEKKNQKLNFVDSKLFYLSKNQEIIFLTDLKTLNYSYTENLLQKLNSKLNIFNIPINLNLDHDIRNNKITAEIESFPLRLSIQNDSYYDSEKLDGQLDISVINKNKKINYLLKENSLKFNTNDDEIVGNINIKPFFISSNLNLRNMKLKEFFDNNSVVINLLKSELLTNKNITGKLNVVLDGLYDLRYINKIIFDVQFEEGLIFISNLNFVFKDSIIFNFNNVSVIVDENKLKFIGDAVLEFKDIQSFYNHFQIIRNFRKNINQISLNFVFNFDDELFEFDDLKISGIDKKISDQYLNKLNSEKKNLLNKITFRNTIRDFFKEISLD